MRIAIVGAGAVGQLFGALLARAGHDVAFVARGEALAAIASRGIAVDTPGGAFQTVPLRASADPAELGARDAVIVAVKSFQVEGVAPTLAPLVGSSSLAVTVQNGVEAPDQLARGLGRKDATVLGVCHVLATRVAAAAVHHAGPAPELLMGAYSGSSDRLEPLAAALRGAGIEATVVADARLPLWTKLLFVEPLGSVGAAARSPAGIVRSVPETRALLERAMTEVGAVARAQGVDLPEDVVTRSLARVDAIPAGATTSMHRDLVEGRRSELHEQTGAVVRLGERGKVPCPIHEFLMATLLPQELSNQGRPVRG
jgi:2-dehydropantoate 2-reductase